MKAQVRFNVGQAEYSLSLEESTNMETLHTMAVLGNPPRYCKLCQNSEHFSLDSNKDKESNIYVNVTCKKCWSKAKLGQYKAGGYFWHDFKAWKKIGDDVPVRDDTPPDYENPQEETDVAPF